MIKQFHELKIGDVFSTDLSFCRLKLCKIGEPIKGVRTSQQLPNAIVIGKEYSIDSAINYFTSDIESYVVLNYDRPVRLIKSIYDDKYVKDIYTYY